MKRRRIIFWSCFVLALHSIVRGREPAGEKIVSVSQIADRIEQVTFASEAFQESKTFCVILPENYSATKPNWPVLYLLHGRGRNERSLIDEPGARAELLKAQFVIVLPSGEDGWYVDLPIDPKQKYAGLLAEAIAAAEAKYRLSSDQKYRAIAGWSMGGYGAVHYAATHPNEFALVASIIGLVDFPRDGLPGGQSYDVPTKVFGNNAAEWRKWNPMNSAENLRTTSVLLISADEAFDRTMNENFRNRLRELKIDHEWIMLKGKHHLDVVKQALPLVLSQVQKQFDKNDSARQAEPLLKP